MKTRSFEVSFVFSAYNACRYQCVRHRHPVNGVTLHTTCATHGNRQFSYSVISMTTLRSDILRFTGHRHLRQRVLLCIISGKSIRIDQIRTDDIHVGLRDYEVNFLRLIEKITNGSTIEISVTGENFSYGYERLVHGQVVPLKRNIIPSPSWSTPRRYLSPHLSCQSSHRLLPRNAHPFGTVEQENTQHYTPWSNRRV